MPCVNDHRAEGRIALALVLFGVAVLAPTGAWAAEEQLGKLAAAQNQVETKMSSGGDWEKSILHQPLHALDRIRTGAESRAAILYSDQTLQRINERSEVEILAPNAGNPGALRVITGTHYFSSSNPKVATPWKGWVTPLLNNGSSKTSWST